MFLEILLLLAGVVAYFSYKLNRKHSTHWQSQGVKCPPSEFPLGNSPQFCADVLLARVNAIDVSKRQYNLMKGEKFYGVYLMSQPVVVLTDPDLIKAVLVKDFNHFVDRQGKGTMDIFAGGGTRVDEIWRRQLSSSGGDEWKNTRTTFSPIFTSGKMKAMMGFIQEVNQRLMASFEEEAVKGAEFELKEKFGRFSMDTIASCAFGMDAQSFTNPKSVFVKHARNIFKRYPMDSAKFMLMMMPGGKHVMKLLQMSLFKPTETKFFDEALLTTLRERQKSNVRRNDLIDMMLDAMKDTSNEAADDKDEDEDTKFSHKADKKDLDDITIVATALIMLVAGYDTTAQTLSYCAFELARNQDIQKRLQDEVDDAIERSNGKLPDYTTIQGMEYLDMVFHETLRLHPAAAILQRACVQDYVIPDTNIKISKGTEVNVNAAGLHSDPKYYPEPEKFNPEHFSKAGKAARHPYTYLGFGQGPRNCIGMRFAILEAKVALISLLSKYNILKGEKTVEPVELDPASVLGASKHGLFVKITPRA